MFSRRAMTIVVISLTIVFAFGTVALAGGPMKKRPPRPALVEVGSVPFIWFKTWTTGN